MPPTFAQTPFDRGCQRSGLVAATTRNLRPQCRKLSKIGAILRKRFYLKPHNTGFDVTHGSAGRPGCPPPSARLCEPGLPPPGSLLRRRSGRWRRATGLSLVERRMDEKKAAGSGSNQQDRYRQLQMASLPWQARHPHAATFVRTCVNVFLLGRVMNSTVTVDGSVLYVL